MLRLVTQPSLLPCLLMIIFNSKLFHTSTCFLFLWICFIISFCFLRTLGKRQKNFASLKYVVDDGNPFLLHSLRQFLRRTCQDWCHYSISRKFERWKVKNLIHFNRFEPNEHFNSYFFILSSLGIYQCCSWQIIAAPFQISDLIARSTLSYWIALQKGFAVVNAFGEGKRLSWSRRNGVSETSKLKACFNIRWKCSFQNIYACSVQRFCAVPFIAFPFFVSEN